MKGIMKGIMALVTVFALAASTFFGAAATALGGTLPAQLDDGNYSVEVTLAGGAGKASVSSPAAMTISGAQAVATIEWSSPNYDYMIVDAHKYTPTNSSGNSTFEIPVTTFDEPISVVGDTTAMGTPYEIDYTLTFDSSTIQANATDEFPWPIFIIIFAVTAFAVIAVIALFHGRRRYGVGEDALEAELEKTLSQKQFNDNLETFDDT